MFVLDAVLRGRPQSVLAQEYEQRLGADGPAHGRRHAVRRCNIETLQNLRAEKLATDAAHAPGLAVAEVRVATAVSAMRL